MELLVRDRALRARLILPVMVAALCTLVGTQAVLNSIFDETFVGKATSNALAIAAVFPWLLLLLRPDTSGLGADARTAGRTIVRAVFYTGVLLAALAAASGLGQSPPQVRADLPPPGTWLLTATAFLGQVAAEEALFRVLLPIVLSIAFTTKKDSFFWGAVLSNLAFAWWHIPATLPAFIDHFAFGLLMAFLYTRTRSFLTLIVVHVGNNYFTLVIDAPLVASTEVVTLLLIIKYALLFWLAKVVFAAPSVSTQHGQSGSNRPGSRLESLDILRGVALIMIVVENSLFYAVPEWAVAVPTSEDQLTRGVLALLIEHRGLPIFCILLGFTAHLTLTSGTGGRQRLSTRAICFLVLGAIHGIFIFPGDILAIFGVALLGLLWIDRRTVTARRAATWITACGFVLQAAFAAWGSALSVNFSDVSVGVASFPEATLTRAIEWLAYVLTVPLHASAVLFPVLIGFTTWKTLSQKAPGTRKIITWAVGAIALSVLLCLPNALFLSSNWGESRSATFIFSAQIGGLLGALGAWLLAAGLHRNAARSAEVSCFLQRLLTNLGRRTLSLYLGSSVVFFVALSPAGLNLLAYTPLWMIWCCILLGLALYALKVRAGRSSTGWAECAQAQFSRVPEGRRREHEWNQAKGDNRAEWIAIKS